MAIQVNGTQVIGNSRELTNIASVDATTVAALGAAGVGGGVSSPAFDPSATPNVTLTTSGTWTKPGSIGDDDWVVFYLVGGGGGGSGSSTWYRGGGGGAATLFAALGQHIPSSVVYTIGNGGSATGNQNATEGYPTSMVFGYNTITANGAAPIGGNDDESANNRTPGAGGLPLLGDPRIMGIGQTAYEGGTTGKVGTSAIANSVFGGGGGASGYDTSQVGGTSTYAGNGGATNNGASPGVPGGGGAGSRNYYYQSGAQGSIRIYYL